MKSKPGVWSLRNSGLEQARQIRAFPRHLKATGETHPSLSQRCGDAQPPSGAPTRGPVSVYAYTVCRLCRVVLQRGDSGWVRRDDEAVEGGPSSVGSSLGLGILAQST